LNATVSGGSVAFAFRGTVKKSCQADSLEVKSPQIADVIGQKMISEQPFINSKSAWYKGPAEEEIRVA